MPAAKKGGFYAVKVGRTPGVYLTWDEASAQVNNFQGAKHKKFPTRAEADAFVSGYELVPPPPTIPRTRPAPSSSSSSAAAASTSVEASSSRPAKRAKFDPSENIFKTKNTRTVFCDGSCLGNGQKGSTAGIGVYWTAMEHNSLNLSERLPGPIQTNNRAEMYAVARILEMDPNPEQSLTICTDSQYTISVFSEWIPNWRKRGWRTADNSPVINKDLIQYVVSLITLRMPPNSYSPTANVSFQKVKAHVGIEGNEQADRFAKNGASLPEVKARDFDEERKKVELKIKERGSKTEVVDLTFEVDCDEGDLLTDEELRNMEKSQYFD